MKIEELSQMTGAEIYATVASVKRTSQSKPYEVYKAEMQVLVDEINHRGNNVAKKFGKKYRPVTVGYLMR